MLKLGPEGGDTGPNEDILMNKEELWKGLSGWTAGGQAGSLGLCSLMLHTVTQTQERYCPCPIEKDLP